MKMDNVQPSALLDVSWDALQDGYVQGSRMLKSHRLGKGTKCSNPKCGAESTVDLRESCLICGHENFGVEVSRGRDGVERIRIAAAARVIVAQSRQS
jgi:hypothetical protein